MNDKKISQLPVLNDPLLNDIVVVNHNDVTYQSSIDSIKTIILSGVSVAGSSGTSGTSGSIGDSGSSGTSGTSGSIGDSGSSGTSGTSGGASYACYSWNTGYFNLVNLSENFPKWDLEDFNSHPSVFELVNSGVSGDTGARIHIKSSGYYEFTSQVHLYDLQSAVNVLVSLNSSLTSNGIMSIVTKGLFNDSIFSDPAGADQLLNGTMGVYVSSPGYYTVTVNPTAEEPYPSISSTTPSRLFIKKIV
jgi:hypothetical protein